MSTLSNCWYSYNQYTFLSTSLIWLEQRLHETQNLTLANRYYICFMYSGVVNSDGEAHEIKKHHGDLKSQGLISGKTDSFFT